MSDTAADMLARVGLMARGDPTWDLSARDLAALRHVLKLAQAAPSPSHEPLVAELAAERQRTARLREALREISICANPSDPHDRRVMRPVLDIAVAALASEEGQAAPLGGAGTLDPHGRALDYHLAMGGSEPDE